ncbi:hypothetical protein [Methylotenera sp.]|uniref:hypothetical protein n=1 Tax=Methylotenera sp. TaxID=2051956 RepID=UPI00248A7685|nr:hypothetical protein [Methylotenera sp.]MDI1361599.1 hypothetical protein [Methylotenera sp.]
MNTINQLTNKEVAVFTVCNLAYLPRALVLADSLSRHNSGRLKVIIFDKKIELPDATRIADIIWIEDIGVPKLSELAFMYDIIEFSTSLKPFIALKLLQTHQSVIFMDPDTCLFASLAPIIEELQQSPIILTPHYTTPQPNTAHESDLAMMRFGSFNLGFFAVNNSSEANSFLAWWSERCIAFSFMESQFGLSTDQKWVTIAPCLFKDIHISFNLGYNVAPWNTYERQITKTDAGNYIVNNLYPLVFFHFSNFVAADPEYLNKRASCEAGERKPVLLELGLFYKEALQEMTAKVGLSKYSYDYMSDGAYISPTLRRAYAAVRSELAPNHDPFDVQGPVGNFARKNHLLEKTESKYVPQGTKDAENHGLTFTLIYFIMRQILRFVGPNKFYNLSRLFVYLSAYRKNRALWKL